MRLTSLLILTALLVGCSPLAGGDYLIGYPHIISGEVVKEPSTRYVRGVEGTGGQEKVSLTLEVDPMMIPGTMTDMYSPSSHHLVVECLSTRCTQIEMGEKHELKCRTVGRFLEPNVIDCRHVKQID